MNNDVSASPPTTARWKRMVGGLMMRTQYALTSLGEKLGWEWLIYNPLAQYGFERAARRNAPIVAESTLKLFPSCKTMVDVGCGPGLYVRNFMDRGVNGLGLEYSPRLRRKCEARGVTVYPFDVSVPTPHPPGTPFDLAISLEVAEHVPPSLADAFVRFFVGIADTVVFTAAHPGQGGTAHINEQPREYWIEKFRSVGFTLDEPATIQLAQEFRSRNAHWYLPKNVSVFRRAK